MDYFGVGGFPSGQALPDYAKQDILGFVLGPGLSTLCIVDFGEFEITYNYEGTNKQIDIACNSDADCFSVNKYSDLEDNECWHVVEVDIKTAKFSTYQGITIGDTYSTVQNRYRRSDMRRSQI